MMALNVISGRKTIIRWGFSTKKARICIQAVLIVTSAANSHHLKVWDLQRWKQCWAEVDKGHFEPVMRGYPDIVKCAGNKSASDLYIVCLSVCLCTPYAPAALHSQSFQHQFTSTRIHSCELWRSVFSNFKKFLDTIWIKTCSYTDYLSITTGNQSRQEECE